MTNWEKYKDEINEIIARGSIVALIDGKPCACSKLYKCEPCSLRHEKCEIALLKWLQEEYIEPCPFEKDELVEVSQNGERWELRYFCRIDENREYGKFFTFINGRTSKQTDTAVNWQYCRKYGTLGELV